MNNENEWNFLMEWHQLSLLQNPNIQVIFWVARGQKKGGELHWQWLMVFSVAIVILDNSLDYAVLVDRHYTIRVVLIFVGTLSNLNITNYKFLLHMHVISATNPHYYCKIVPFIKGNCSQNPIRINFFTDLLLPLSATIHFLFVLTCAIFCTHNAGTPDTSAESLLQFIVAPKYLGLNSTAIESARNEAWNELEAQIEFRLSIQTKIYFLRWRHFN